MKKAKQNHTAWCQSCQMLIGQKNLLVRMVEEKEAEYRDLMLKRHKINPKNSDLNPETSHKVNLRHVCGWFLN